jgi:hypothetical protein
MAPDTIHGTTVDRSAGPYPISLSEATIESVGVKPPSVDGRLQGLLGPYTSMRSVHSILAHGGQPIDPSLTQAGATTLTNTIGGDLPADDGGSGGRGEQ